MGGGNNKGGGLNSTASRYTGNGSVERGETKGGENVSFRNIGENGPARGMGEKSMSAMSGGGSSSSSRSMFAPGQGLRQKQFSKTLPTPGKAKGQGLGGGNVSLRNLGKVVEGWIDSRIHPNTPLWSLRHLCINQHV